LARSIITGVVSKHAQTATDQRVDERFDQSGSRINAVPRHAQLFVAAGAVSSFAAIAFWIEHYIGAYAAISLRFVEHVALVAVADEERHPTLIVGGRYHVVEPGKAESPSLIDEYQAKGIGSVLVRHLVASGREVGLRELVAEVVSDNFPMLSVFERSCLAMNTRREGAAFHVTLRCS
jgi:GNAT superfamily N-acetyltransferase